MKHALSDALKNAQSPSMSTAEGNALGGHALHRLTVRPIALLSALLFAFGLAFALAGCASDDDEATEGSDASNGTLRVAMELAYPPFETKDDAGNPEGLAVDFIRDFGKAYGYDVQIENTAWDGLIPSLQSDKADLIISSMTITDERKQSVDFSDPYAMAQLAILANADSEVESIDDLDQAGKKVAVKTGSTGDVYATKNPPTRTSCVWRTKAPA